MKLKQNQSSTQPQTSKRSVDEYGYPLYLDAENDPALTSEVVDYYAQLEQQSVPGKAVFHSSAQTFEYSRVLQFSTGEVSYRRMAADGYPLYIDPNNDPYAYLKRPNPPTPEAVAKAQFVDKTYVWQGK